MNHQDPRLTAYALGELSEAERAEVEALLAASPTDAQQVEETREMADLLSRAFSQEAAAPVDPGVLAAVRLERPPLEMKDTDRPPRIPWFVSWRWGWGVALGAAAALLLIVAGWWLAGDGSRSNVLKIATAPTTDLPRTEPASTSQSIPTAPRETEPLANPRMSSPVSERTDTAIPASGQPTSPSTAPRTGGGSLGGAVAPGAGPTYRDQLSFSMSPELMNRHGLTPAPGPEAGRRPSGTAVRTMEAVRASAAPDAQTLSLDGGRLGETSPEWRPRYGLRPTLRESLEQKVAKAEDPNVILRGRRAYAESWEYREPTANPGYVDAGVNGFQSAATEPLSTFGLDVDTGSYANVRRFLAQGQLPPAAAVRVEEMINYFPYAYSAPKGDEVFAVDVEVGSCPWDVDHRLVRMAIRARDVAGERPAGNLVFLIDVSGSMAPAERLPLLKQALRSFVKRLAPADHVAIVTYASRAGVLLPSTSCEDKARILAAIDSLEAGGSTNGEGGIREAYDAAVRHFAPGGINRVLLCTDGDFNVGIRDPDDLVRLVKERARSGVFLTTLGVGTANFKDALMRRLADEGNGTYHYLDSFEEAQRVLIDQMDSTLVTVARDAKAQVEFNPGRVAAWKLIGYEKRLMPAQDFNDDTRDAGEIGAGHAVTLLYEVVPAGQMVPGRVDALKYQRPPPVEGVPASIVRSPELLTLKLRYQRPEGSKSALLEVPVTDAGEGFERKSADFRFAAAVAAFGMTLHPAPGERGPGMDLTLDLARQSLGHDPGGWRAEFITLVKKARQLMGSQGLPIEPAGRIGPRPGREPGTRFE